MNLFEFRFWQRTKIWMMVIVPLIIIFLFIQPYFSLFLFFVILMRLLYVKFMQSLFNEGVQESEKQFNKKIEKITQDIKQSIKTTRNNYK